MLIINKMLLKIFITRALTTCLFFTIPAIAGEADVMNVEIINEGDGRYTFEVTVQHDDTGWDHYADRWEILITEDKVIAVRVLRHPHVKEQPFTRRLHFVQIADEVDEVVIRAHCLVDEFSGNQVTAKIPR